MSPLQRQPPPEAISPQVGAGEQIVKMAREFSGEWQKHENTVDKVIRSLPRGFADMIKLQVSVERLHLYSEFMSRAAESVASVVRRVQHPG